jgi:uncharacterized membrane protein
MDKPQEVLIATFSGEKSAGEALKALKSWGKSNDIKVIKAAVLTRDSNGKTAVHQDKDVGAGEGSLFGAVSGAVIGLLGGPVGAVVGAAAGAATGGATAAAVNMGFSDDELKAIRNNLTPNSSTLIALVEDRYLADFQKELNRYSNQIWHRAVPEYYLRNVRERG